MSIDFRKVLITGGVGFVGANLAIFLSRQLPNLSITCLDNLKRRGSEFNIRRLQEANVPFIHGDVRCPEDLDSLDVDLLIECSAEPSILAGYKAPLYMINTNFVGAVHCLELCRRFGAAFLFISTSRVYPIPSLLEIQLIETDERFTPCADQALPGISPLGISEEFPISGPRSLYGAAKYASELFIEEYHAAYHVPTVINRCGIIAGPWQMGKVDQGIVALWVMRHHFQMPLCYIGFGGTGKQVRDFLDIDDFCALVLMQLTHFDKVNGQVFNIGGGPKRSVSLRELTELCRMKMGCEIPLGSESSTRPGDVPFYVTDNSRISAALGWSPVLSREETIEKIARWVRDNEQMLRPLL
ncbi:MAG: NAD-dependent epimerase/dehydratase family protein [Acidobacteria bacterium]|nr:NAD-dependent epimerase/dehydratase family protein [Acidobacteriota bacterium]